MSSSSTVAIGSPNGANVAEVSPAGALVVQGHQSPRTAGTITSASSVVGPVNVTNYNIVTVTIRGTHSGINLAFEVSDDGGANWFPVMGGRDEIFSAAATSGVITANASLGWTVTIGAYTHFRVRATAWTSGTAHVGITAQAMPYEPNPTVGVSGTVTTAGTTTATVAPGSSNKVTTTASTNTANVKATAASLYAITAHNPTASPAYLKLYDKATAPTPGTDAPVWVVEIPANSDVSQTFPPVGARYGVGLGRAVTGARADMDTTPAVVGVVVMLTYA